VRVLRLKSINPGGLLCLVFFEGTIALAVLLTLAEQVRWWAVIALPAAVALMVKFNDVVAGSLLRAAPRRPRAVGRAKVPGSVPAEGASPIAVSRAALEAASPAGPDSTRDTLPLTDVGAPRSTSATTRQSAARRYR
jgi:hypothetical protein